MSFSRKFTYGLDYSGMDLTAVPTLPTSNEAVFELNLAVNNIQSLNRSSFTGYDDLKFLDLRDNGLK